MTCITCVSASVVVSPIARPSATSRSSRRMILPERVFGSSCTTNTRRGFAMAPIWSETCFRRTSFGSSSPSAIASAERRITKATTAWPVASSDAPTTAASATYGCAAREDSISAVDRRWPETFITSSTRPSSQMSPSSSSLAPSPAK